MRILVLFLMIISTEAYGESIGLAIPSAPGNYQSDSFKAGSLDCSNSIGSATNLEVGVTGLIDGGGSDGVNVLPRQDPDVGVYARIIVPLGKTAKSRIDCNRLYELELRKKQLEVIKLEREIQALRKLEFEE